MTLPEFLIALFERGRVRVGPWDENIDAEQEVAAGGVLAEQERNGRDDFPGHPPDFHPAAALWSARAFYRACQLAAYRDIDQETLQRTLSEPFPGQPTAAAHYSVDLVFCYLGDLTKLVQSAATEDPLVKALQAWGAQWPLSSVGMKGIEPETANELLDHRGLLRWYADRIMNRADLSRLNDPRVRVAVQEAIGGHPSLAPSIHAALQSYSSGAAS